jgi:hypothetical protein
VGCGHDSRPVQPKCHVCAGVPSPQAGSPPPHVRWSEPSTEAAAQRACLQPCWATWPNFIGSFWKCVGPGCPTTLGPAAKLNPIAFDRECNAPAAIVDSKHNRATPPTKIPTAHFLLTQKDNPTPSSLCNSLWQGQPYHYVSPTYNAFSKEKTQTVQFTVKALTCYSTRAIAVQNM